jgi:hypothetical protein
VTSASTEAIGWPGYSLCGRRSRAALAKEELHRLFRTSGGRRDLIGGMIHDGRALRWEVGAAVVGAHRLRGGEGKGIARGPRPAITGSGARATIPGDGLAGLAERVYAVSGRLAATNSNGWFRLLIEIPDPSTER